MRTTATAFRALERIAYGIYAWIALSIAVLPVAIGLAVVPGVLRRRALARWGARTFFALIGSPIRVEGEPVPDREPCIVVANHASYLDGLILTAALPARFTFVIKHEMARLPLAGFVLRRLGSEFVDRGDARHRNRVARRVLEGAQRGEALAFFPEGAIEAAPGLKPFHGGAFRAAFRARAALVPVVIHGARDKLPAGAALAAAGPLRVRFCEPLPAARFDSAQSLLHAARAVILAHLDEPDAGTAAYMPT